MTLSLYCNSLDQVCLLGYTFMFLCCEVKICPPYREILQIVKAALHSCVWHSCTTALVMSTNSCMPGWFSLCSICCIYGYQCPWAQNMYCETTVCIWKKYQEVTQSVYIFLFCCNWYDTCRYSLWDRKSTMQEWHCLSLSLSQSTIPMAPHSLRPLPLSLILPLPLLLPLFSALLWPEELLTDHRHKLKSKITVVCIPLQLFVVWGK